MSGRYFLLFLLLAVGSTFAMAVEPDTFRPLSHPLLKFANEPGEPFKITQGAESLLMIHYGGELDPDRFHATLNGQDVTANFHPGPRESESMRQLPFKLGSNRLEFDVWRLPRRDLPKGALLDNEIHRLEVIVEEKPEIRPIAISGAAAAPRER